VATALQSLQQFDSVRRRETKVGNNVWERLGKVAIRRMLVSVPKLFGIYVSVARRCIYFRELSLMRYAQDKLVVLYAVGMARHKMCFNTLQIYESSVLLVWRGTQNCKTVDIYVRSKT